MWDVHPGFPGAGGNSVVLRRAAKARSFGDVRRQSKKVKKRLTPNKCRNSPDDGSIFYESRESKDT